MRRRNTRSARSCRQCSRKNLQSLLNGCTRHRRLSQNHPSRRRARPTGGVLWKRGGSGCQIPDAHPAASLLKAAPMLKSWCIFHARTCALPLSSKPRPSRGRCGCRYAAPASRVGTVVIRAARAAAVEQAFGRPGTRHGTCSASRPHTLYRAACQAKGRARGTADPPSVKAPVVSARWRLGGFCLQGADGH